MVKPRFTPASAWALWASERYSAVPGAGFTRETTMRDRTQPNPLNPLSEDELKDLELDQAVGGVVNEAPSEAVKFEYGALQIRYHTQGSGN